MADRVECRMVALPPAIPQLRHEIVHYAETLGASPAALEALKLAVSEALTNVVLHAYVKRRPGPVIVETWADEDEQLVVRVCDEGAGLIPRADSPGLGLGFGLMGNLADEFVVANRENTPGTVVRLRFTLSRETIPDRTSLFQNA